MKSFNRIIFALAVISALIIIIYSWNGGFRKIKFSEGDSGGETIVYQNVTGDYSVTDGVARKLHKYLNETMHISSEKCFSMYSTNPHVIEKNEIKSEAGCIVTDTSKLASLSSMYKYRTIAVEKYVTATLPYKCKISALIYMLKVYPRLYDYMKSKGYDISAPVSEIFDFKNGTATYRMKIITKEAK
jgi:hypothetical protein